jgi:metallo-beta-lactamase family protein
MHAYEGRIEVKRPPEQVYVVHGEPAAADALRCRIQDELGLPVRVPQHGETVEL